MARPDADHTDRPHRPTRSWSRPATDRPRPTSGAEPVPLTIDEAAIALGITSNAVRQRLKRGILPGEKTAGGWVVWLPADQATTGDQPTGQLPTTCRPASDRPRTTSGVGVDLARWPS